MSNTYRFHLPKYRPGSKTTCPKCQHKKCFTRYVDALGIVHFPDYVGYCDRCDKCGYHYTPRQFFQEHPDCRPDAGMREIPPFMVRREDPTPPSFMDVKIMEQSLGHYEINRLYLFLSRRWGKETVDAIFRRYHVGTANLWGGSTVFWQVDAKGRVRTGKVILYDATTGHRVKDERARVSWVHSLMRLPEFHLCQCLFGEHLLTIHPRRKVVLVESEKSALIGAHFLPCYVWLATGGKNVGFHPDMLKALSGREVMLVPDLKATEEWQRKLPLLQSVCRHVELFDKLEELASEEQREEGWDIADFLLQENEGLPML
jgi:hypothetical protein